MKWPDQLSQVKVKARHSNASQESKNACQKKSIMQPAEAFSITETEPSFFAVLTSANVFCASGSQSYPCWQ